MQKTISVQIFALLGILLAAASAGAATYRFGGHMCHTATTNSYADTAGFYVNNSGGNYIWCPIGGYASTYNDVDITDAAIIYKDNAASTSLSCQIIGNNWDETLYTKLVPVREAEFLL